MVRNGSTIVQSTRARRKEAHGHQKLRSTSRRSPALIELARRGEGGAGDLLGVEPIGANQGAVLAGREGAGDRLRREVVAEAVEVLDAGGGGGGGDAIRGRASLLLVLRTTRHANRAGESRRGTGGGGKVRETARERACVPCAIRESGKRVLIAKMGLGG